MTTHQAIAGMTDAEMLQRMLNSHAERISEAFWVFFEAYVGQQLPANPTVVDLGCGPGLFLHDLAGRHPDTRMYGYDITPAMIEHAQRLKFPASAPILRVLDVSSQPLPLDTGVAHLVCMTAVLHVIDEPLPVLAEVRRVLAPDGIFLLHDWIRTPLQTYLSSRVEGTGEDLAASRRRWFKLFPIHNKYTEEDWCWLVTEAGFAVQCSMQLRAHSRIFLNRPA